MSSTTATEVAKPNPKRNWILFAMSLGFTMTMIDATIVAVALPTMQVDLGLSGVERAWVINAYLLVLAVSIAAAGRFSDVFGRRRIFMLGIVIFTLSSIACGFAPNPTVLLIARAFEGFGAALMTPTSQAIVTASFPVNERGRALGLYSGIAAAGIALGPLIGGFLTTFVSWRAIFYVNVPVGIAAILLTIYSNPTEFKSDSVKNDWIGLGSLVIGLSAIVVALMEGTYWGFGSVKFWTVLSIGIGLMLLFVMVELHKRQPLINLKLFTFKNFAADNIVMGILRFALFGIAVYGPIYTQDVLGFSPVVAGTATLPQTIFLVITSPISGRLYDKLGPKKLIASGSLLTGFGVLWLSLVAFPHFSYWLMVPAYIVAGIGIGLMVSPLLTDAMNSSPSKLRGQAAGVMGTVQQVGGTIGVAVLTAFIVPATTIYATKNLAAIGVSYSSEQIQTMLAQHNAGQPIPGVTSQDISAVKNAFTTALSQSYLIIVGLLIVSILIALFVIKHYKFGKSERPTVSG